MVKIMEDKRFMLSELKEVKLII